MITKVMMAAAVIGLMLGSWGALNPAAAWCTGVSKDIRCDSPSNASCVYSGGGQYRCSRTGS
jgi:hypothetical protein